LRRQRPRTMGSLYWQLNDCWPVASWASIDYYGRWKALHYYARRFYDDVLVSPFLHDDKVDIYVVTDKLQPLSGTIHTRLLDFSGKTLLDQSKEIQAPAQSSAIYVRPRGPVSLSGAQSRTASHSRFGAVACFHPWDLLSSGIDPPTRQTSEYNML
jgi:hypothetical protein